MTVATKITIKPARGWQIIDVREILRYRDLFVFLVWRDIKVRYTQSVLGIGWAVVQPLAMMLVFTIVFSRLAGISTDGAPPSVFYYTALVPWLYFANTLNDSAGSLTSNMALLTKVYFPRLVLPLTAVFSKGVDFCIAFSILIAMILFYGVYPGFSVVYLPLLIFVMILAAAGLGMWLTALSVQYRDVRYGLSFGIQLLMFAAPVVYPASRIPDKYLVFYSLNPMAGVIEGFRSTLLQTREMPWSMVCVGTVVASVLFVTGAFYFRRMERIFADVV
jgi:lipopolysaccharide transport system permease protein